MHWMTSQLDFEFDIGYYWENRSSFVQGLIGAFDFPEQRDSRKVAAEGIELDPQSFCQSTSLDWNHVASCG